jgi:DNA-binding MarR family transcriptional regulator
MSDGGDSGEFVLALSTSHLLHRAQQLAADRFSKLVGDKGVTLRQFAVLAAIQETPGLNQTELVRVTGIDRSTLADMILRMEKRGWISRAASDADARANAVRLAPAGAGVLSSAVQHAKAADAAILDALPRAKGKAFHHTLVRLSEMSDKAAADAEHKARKEARRKARMEARERAREEKKRLRMEARKDTEKSRKKKRKDRAIEPVAPKAPPRLRKTSSRAASKTGRAVEG